MTQTYGELTVDEIDGVPVVWADVPGPFVAGLMCRVGHADEAFLEAGMTHLVEHLALFGVAQPGDHTNGFVDQTRTVFHTSGTEQEAVDFLAAVTRQIRDLPLERLDAEREVLRAEYASRSGGPIATLMAWRYGTGPWANVAGSPVALHRLQPSRVQEWARLRMSRADAAVFLSGPPPQGLRLHLPEPPEGGSRHVEPRADVAVPILPTLPAWVPGPPDVAALHAVLPRSTGGWVLEQVLRTRLVEELRHRQAAAYSPSVEGTAVTATRSVLTVVTDLLRDRAVDAAPRVLRQVTDLARPVGEEGSVTEEEVARAQEAVLRPFADPRSVLGSVTSGAWALITDAPLRAHAEQVQRLHEVTPADVALAAAQAAACAVALLPEEAGEAIAWTQAPACLEARLLGSGVATHEEPLGTRLIVTPHAVGLRAPEGDWATVSRERTAAVLRWPDGRRVLIGHDATRLVLEPTLWQDGPAQIARIDEAWPAEVTVDMPARDPQDVPQPALAHAGSIPPMAPPPASGLRSEWRDTARALGIAALGCAGLGAFAVALMLWRSALVPAISAAVVTGVWSYRRRRRDALDTDTAARPITTEPEAEARSRIEAPEVPYGPPSSRS
ncbi:MAG: hypothetical protein U0Q15_11345 [Kineosporiaceae bacterium]